MKTGTDLMAGPWRHAAKRPSLFKRIWRKVKQWL